MRLEERINTYGSFLKKRYGRRVFRVGLTTGFQCSHRELNNGCIFCLQETYTDEESSIIDYSLSDRIAKQLENLIPKVKKGIGFPLTEQGAFLAYFQVGIPASIKLSVLREIYQKTLNHPEIVGLIVSARPDEISEEVLIMLKSLEGDVYLELGMQTVHQSSLNFLNRCQDFSTLENTLDLCGQYDLYTGVHLIIGIPGETKADIMETIDYVNSKQQINEVKLHNLVIYKGTKLAECSQEILTQIPDLEAYIEILGMIIARLRKDIVISRLFTSNLKGNNIALNPFSGVKRDWMNRLTKYLNDTEIVQGMNGN